jgi:hypothetical protein
MTETEYRQLPGAEHLPLYDEDYGRCEQLDRPNSSQYDTVTEAIEFDEAQQCIADDSLEFRGGIRYRTDDDEHFVYACFWKLR